MRGLFQKSVALCIMASLIGTSLGANAPTTGPRRIIQDSFEPPVERPTVAEPATFQSHVLDSMKLVDDMGAPQAACQVDETADLLQSKVELNECETHLEVDTAQFLEEVALAHAAYKDPEARDIANEKIEGIIRKWGQGNQQREDALRGLAAMQFALQEKRRWDRLRERLTFEGRDALSPEDRKVVDLLELQPVSKESRAAMERIGAKLAQEGWDLTGLQIDKLSPQSGDAEARRAFIDVYPEAEEQLAEISNPKRQESIFIQNQVLLPPHYKVKHPKRKFTAAITFDAYHERVSHMTGEIKNDLKTMVAASKEGRGLIKGFKTYFTEYFDMRPAVDKMLGTNWSGDFENERTEKVVGATDSIATHLSQLREKYGFSKDKLLAIKSEFTNTSLQAHDDLGKTIDGMTWRAWGVAVALPVSAALLFELGAVAIAKTVVGALSRLPPGLRKSFTFMNYLKGLGWGLASFGLHSGLSSSQTGGDFWCYFGRHLREHGLGALALSALYGPLKALAATKTGLAVIATGATGLAGLDVNEMRRESNHAEDARKKGDESLAQAHDRNFGQAGLALVEKVVFPLFLGASGSARVRGGVQKALDWMKFPTQTSYVNWVKGLFGNLRFSAEAIAKDEAEAIQRLASHKATDAKAPETATKELEAAASARPKDVSLKDWVQTELGKAREKFFLAEKSSEAKTAADAVRKAIGEAEGGMTGKPSPLLNQVLESAENSLRAKAEADTSRLPIEWMKYLQPAEVRKALLTAAEEVLNAQAKAGMNETTVGNAMSALDPLRNLVTPPKGNKLQRTLSWLVEKESREPRSPKRPERILATTAEVGPRVIYSVFNAPGYAARGVTLLPTRAYSLWKGERPAVGVRTTKALEVALDLAAARYIYYNYFETGKAKLSDYVHQKDFADRMETASYDIRYRRVASQVTQQIPEEFREMDVHFVARVLGHFEKEFVAKSLDPDKVVTDNDKTDLSATVDIQFKIFPVAVNWDPELASLEEMVQREIDLPLTHRRTDQPAKRKLDKITIGQYERVFRLRLQQHQRLDLIARAADKLKKNPQLGFTATVNALIAERPDATAGAREANASLKTYFDGLTRSESGQKIEKWMREKKMTAMEAQYYFQELSETDYQDARDDILKLQRMALMVDRSNPAQTRIYQGQATTADKQKQDVLTRFEKEGFKPFQYIVPVTDSGAADLSRARISFDE